MHQRGLIAHQLRDTAATEAARNGVPAIDKPEERGSWKTYSLPRRYVEPAGWVGGLAAWSRRLWIPEALTRAGANGMVACVLLLINAPFT